jgi:hypothetical protein
VDFDRYELMILSRGGRVPRAMHPGPRPLPVPVRSERAERTGPGRLGRLTQRLRRPSRRGGELDVHSYLELEFPVDEDSRAGLSRR